MTKTPNPGRATSEVGRMSMAKMETCQESLQNKVPPQRHCLAGVSAGVRRFAEQRT